MLCDSFNELKLEYINYIHFHTIILDVISIPIL